MNDEEHLHEPGGDEIRRHVGRGPGRHRPHRGHCCRPRRHGQTARRRRQRHGQSHRPAAARRRRCRRQATAPARSPSVRACAPAIATPPARSSKTSADSAALITLIDQKFDSLDEILRGLAAILELTPRISDLIVSYGERISSRIVAAAFRERGIDAAHVDARDIIVTDSQFQKAVPLGRDHRKARRRKAAPPHRRRAKFR